MSQVSGDYSSAPTGWTNFRSAVQDAWKSVFDRVSSPASDDARGSRRSGWNGIRKAVASFVRSAFPAIGTTLFKGPPGAPTVIGSLRTDPVTGGYATLTPTLKLNTPVPATPVEGLEVQAVVVGPDPAPAPEPSGPDTPKVLEILAVKKQKTASKKPEVPPGLEKNEGVPPGQSEGAGPPANRPVFNKGSFTINRVVVSVSTSDTVEEVIAKIDGSGAGVTAAYDSATQRMTLLSTGVTETPITVGDDTSGFLAAVGLDETATSAVPASSSPYDVALTGLPEYAGVVAGVITVNDQTVVIDPSTMTARDVVSAIDALEGVSAVLTEASGKVSISSTGKPITLADTSGLLSALGIAQGTYKGSTSTMVAVPVVHPGPSTAPESEPVAPPEPPAVDAAPPPAASVDQQPAPADVEKPRLRPARVFTRRFGDGSAGARGDEASAPVPARPHPFGSRSHSAPDGTGSGVTRGSRWSWASSVWSMREAAYGRPDGDVFSWRGRSKP